MTPKSGLLRRGLPASLIFLACAAFAASATSPWSTHVWRSDDGLPNNDVISLAQTADGYLWAATDSHLARFDGAQFEEISWRNIVPGVDHKVCALLRGRQGGLLVALSQGPVARLQNGAAEVLATNLPAMTARELFEAADGAVWVIYPDGTLCRIQDGVAQRFDRDSRLPDGYSCSLANDRHGGLWVVKGGKVGRLAAGKFEPVAALDNTRTRMIAAHDGGFWICSGFELLKCDEAGALKNLGRFEAAHPNGGPTVLLEDRSGAVWIGTSDSGLFRYDGEKFESVPTSHSEILSLLEDREGNLWAGTDGGGLNRIGPAAVTLQNCENGLPFETVQSICETPNGGLWAVTENGLLISRTNGEWTTVTNGGRGIVTADCVVADQSGAVWVGMGTQRLLRWRDGQFTTWNRTNGLKSLDIHALLASRAGDIWIGGGEPNSLQCLRAGKIIDFKLPAGISRIGALAEDVKGNIWVGTSKGTLLRVTDSRVIDETGLLAGGPKSIRCLYAAEDGILWIGYAGSGLGRLKDGKLARLTAGQGLYDNRVSQIIADDHGWLWIGADHGIFKVRPEVLADVAEGRDAGFQCIHYGRDAGVSSLQANFGVSPGAMRSRDGRLWIPMRTALAVVNPGVLTEDANAPDVLIRRVMVDAQPVALYGGDLPVRNAVDVQKPGAGLQLSPKHHRIEFEFTALSFRSPENVLFRYRLEGFDDGWQWVDGQRTAVYSRLPAGRYRFQVAACNGDGVWNEAGTTLAFSVAPFLWQTWWFRLAAILGFTLAVIAIVRYVSFHRLRAQLLAAERQAALARERTRIARDIHDDVGSRLTKIVLLSELNLQHPASPERAADRAHQTAAAAREVLKSFDETIWAINPRNDTLPNLIDYLAQFAVDFLPAAGVRCRVELPPRPPRRPVSADVRHNLFLAAKEALNNIARHAQATETWLRVKVTDEALSVLIEDNGRGFGAPPENTGADGLRNMRQRLAESGGQFFIESQPGRGTKVSLVYAWPRRK